MVRGTVFIGTATACCFVAVVLSIFTHIGQISPTSLPHDLGMVSMNVSQFAMCLANSTGDAYPDFYQNNASAPLGEQLGLRDTYSWGFFKYCAYNTSGVGTCTNTTFGYRFTPLEVMISDILFNSSTISQFTIPQSVFTNSSYLGGLSQGGFWLIFIGTILAAVAGLIGAFQSTPTFLSASVFSTLSAVAFLIGASLWTALLQSAMAINTTRAAGGSCLGIHLSYGASLWLVWVAFILMLAAVPLYILSTVTYERLQRSKLNRHPSGRRYKSGR